MSKNKRKRRLKEEDFKKKKFKVGKKLPMPDNVTRTSFKARSINIGQQNLKEDGGGDETNFKGRKLKDLLNSCSHYNIQAREDALLGLKDLFERHPEVLKDNLNEILQRILGLITDLEISVRKVFLTIISLLFKSLSETEISPFFANIVAYLCSAMTHLNESIRLDSMKFLDLCLEYFPQLVRASPKNIIVNFMNVISTEKSSVSKGSGIPVKMELTAKVTSQRTQLELLSRLNRLLQVVFADGHNSSSHKNDIFRGAPVTSENVPRASPSTFSNSNPILISNFSLKASSSEFQTSPTDEKWLTEFISSLAPVLFEYWVECCPAEFSMNLIPVKKASVSLQIMKEILEIFTTLVGSLEKNISDKSVFHEFLNGKLFLQFNTHFVTVFPLSFTLQQSGRKAKKDESAESITDVGLNILIAEVLSYYIPELKPEVKNLPRWASEVLVYLQKVFVVNGKQAKLTAPDTKSLAKLVKMFLLNLPDGFESEKVGLLQSIYELFEATRATSHMKKTLLEFLAEIVDGARSQQPTMKTMLDKWLRSLLRMLNSKEIGPGVKYKVLCVVKTGILQGFQSLTNATPAALLLIFEVENFSKLNEITQQLVVELFYHICQVPSQELFGVLAKLCVTSCLSMQVFNYLMFVIHQLVHSKPGSSSVVSTIADYLSFMFSVIVGHTSNQLESFQQFEKEHPDCYSYNEISGLNTIVARVECNSGNSNFTDTEESWEHTNKIIEIVGQLLAQSDYSTRFLEMLEAPLTKLFSKYSTLPLEAVYRLLHLVETLLCLTKETDCSGQRELLAFTTNWCSLLWHFLLTVPVQFEKVKFTIIHLKAITSKLCKSSEIVLKNMLDSFVPGTTHGFSPQLTCQVLTDVLKELQSSLTVAHQSTLEDLYQNLEQACNEGSLNSQVFSDFKYQYQCCKNVSNSVQVLQE